MVGEVESQPGECDVRRQVKKMYTKEKGVSNCIGYFHGPSKMRIDHCI